MTADALVHTDHLLDMGCPPGLVEQAAAFALRARRKLVERYGPDAPLARIEDVLAECLDDPAGVLREGAADDLLGDLEDEARAFAALVAASRKGGGV